MNNVACSKINTIENHLHEYARHECPKFMDAEPCQNCDIECPFDQLFSKISQIKKQ